MSRAALAYLAEVAGADAASKAAIAQLRSRLGGGEGTAADPALRRLRRDVIAIEAAELTRLYEDGTIGADTRQQLQRRLDLEETSLGE